MTAYYNENNRFAAEWLRRLIRAGHIAHGVVDERSITEVRADELTAYTQCHFFAGIGIWSYALRQAGWPDSEPVWTGSCPCQPFSDIGKHKGVNDDRHLWPDFAKLIKERQPPVIFGEQVASSAGRSWLSTVRNDLGNMGYGVGAADLCAASVGAPHIRQRLYWVAHSDSRGLDKFSPPRLHVPRQGRPNAAGRSENDRVDDTVSERLEGHGEHKAEEGRAVENRPTAETGTLNGSNTHSSIWSSVDWLWCRDKKWRPIEPKLKPLVNGGASRVGRLRAYGNGICAPLAQAFIESYMQAAEDIYKADK